MHWLMFGYFRGKRRDQIQFDTSVKSYQRIAFELGYIFGKIFNRSTVDLKIPSFKSILERKQESLDNFSISRYTLQKPEDEKHKD
jgi:hypothetical protein